MGRFTILLLAAALSFAGIAIAAQGGGSANVTLCAAKKGGALSLGRKGKCQKGQRKVTIAKQGPTGPAGEQGAPGTTASVQPEAPVLIAPARPAAQGSCEANPGTFCGDPASAKWENLSPAFGGGGIQPASFQKDAGGYVHLTGRPSGPSTSPIFYLPPGYRPLGRMQFAVTGCDILNEIEAVRIEPDGKVVTTSGCIALDGITFHP